MKSQNHSESDRCSRCKDHAEFIDGLSNCCGAPPLNVEVDLEDRRSLMSHSRAAVMVFAAVVSIGCATAPRAETPVTVHRESIVHEANELRAIAIYCTIKNRGLENDPKYSMFYNVVKDEFAKVRCGNYGTVQGD